MIRCFSICLLLALASCTREKPDDKEPPQPVDAESQPDVPLADQLAKAKAGETDVIRLWHTPATDTDAKLIASSPGAAHIIRIVFNNTTITDTGLAALATMPALETLRIRSNAITDAGLVAITRCRTLRHLILVDSPVTDAGLLPLADLPALESLYLIDTPVTDAGVAALLKQRPTLHVHW